MLLVWTLSSVRPRLKRTVLLDRLSTVESWVVGQFGFQTDPLPNLAGDTGREERGRGEETVGFVSAWSGISRLYDMRSRYSSSCESASSFFHLKEWTGGLFRMVK